MTNKSISLSYKSIGDGKTLIIIHGLYGDGSNWSSIAREFASNYQVVTPDVRNHGNSPHTEEHSYVSMVEDIYELIHTLNKDSVFMMGHSMGGKIAMKFALTYPELVDKLVVVDVSPKDYSLLDRAKDGPNDHEYIIRTLQNLQIQSMITRTEIDDELAKYISSTTLRNFLLKSIIRTPEGFSWKLNLSVLKKYLPHIMGDFDNELRVFQGSTLFIKGDSSPFIKDEDIIKIKQNFPNYSLVEIRDAGHWLHAQQPQQVISVLRKFLNT